MAHRLLLLEVQGLPLAHNKAWILNPSFSFL
nr:MAG TPA: hypothetical protein [Caudoviricetes sp.]